MAVEALGAYISAASAPVFASTAGASNEVGLVASLHSPMVGRRFDVRFLTIVICFFAATI